MEQEPVPVIQPNALARLGLPAGTRAGDLLRKVRPPGSPTASTGG